MGLDQYLTKKTYIGNQYRKPEEMVTINMPLTQDKTVFPIKQPIIVKRIQNIEEEVAYWRKANQIHNWFIENVQGGNDDCQESNVLEEQLQELVDLCKKVLENHELAEELLPSQGGFFFGTTEYDEWYFGQLENTIEILESVLNEKGDAEYTSGEFYYRASW